MQEVLYIEAVDQTAALLKPLRLAVLKRLDQPRSCPELADTLGEPTRNSTITSKSSNESG
ncbi:MAG: helix-turn-helix domain-containing protein [Thermomicrobiales bacterium]